MDRRRTYLELKLRGAIMSQVLLLYIYCLKSTRQKSAAELIDFILDINTDLTEMVLIVQPGRVAQSVGHLTRKSGVLGSIPGRATYFRFSFRFFKKGSCQLLAKVCARSTG